MFRRKPRMTGARALIAIGSSVIEQRHDGPASCGPFHPGAGCEEMRVAARQPTTPILALDLAAVAVLTATEVDDVKVSHAARRTLPRARQAPDIQPSASLVQS
jgi:hypothetical protein